MFAKSEKAIAFLIWKALLFSVVALTTIQERGRTPTHSEHANTGLPKSVHLGPHYEKGLALQSV